MANTTGVVNSGTNNQTQAEGNASTRQQAQFDPDTQPLQKRTQTITDIPDVITDKSDTAQHRIGLENMKATNAANKEQQQAALNQRQTMDWNALGKSLSDAVAQQSTQAFNKYSSQNQSSQQAQERQFQTRAMHNQQLQELLAKQGETDLELQKFALQDGAELQKTERDEYRSAYLNALSAGNPNQAKAIMEKFPEYFIGYDINRDWADAILDNIDYQLTSWEDELYGPVLADGTRDATRGIAAKTDIDSIERAEYLRGLINEMKGAKDYVDRSITSGTLGDDFWEYQITQWSGMPASTFVTENKGLVNESLSRFQSYLNNSKNSDVPFGEAIARTTGKVITNVQDLLKAGFSDERYGEIGKLSYFLEMLDSTDNTQVRYALSDPTIGALFAKYGMTDMYNRFAQQYNKDVNATGGDETHIRTIMEDGTVDTHPEITAKMQKLLETLGGVGEFQTGRIRKGSRDKGVEAARENNKKVYSELQEIAKQVGLNTEVATQDADKLQSLGFDYQKDWINKLRKEIEDELNKRIGG